MAKKKRSKQSKASMEAAKALKGQQTTREQKFRQVVEDFNKPSDGTIFGGRVTWRAVRLFLYTCLILDLIAYLITSFVFNTCYGVMCWLS